MRLGGCYPPTWLLRMMQQNKMATLLVALGINKRLPELNPPVLF